MTSRIENIHIEDQEISPETKISPSSTSSFSPSSSRLTDPKLVNRTIERIFKDIDRLIEKLKLYSYPGNSLVSSKSLIEKENLTNRLMDKLDECKSLLYKGDNNLFISMFEKKLIFCKNFLPSNSQRNSLDSPDSTSKKRYSYGSVSLPNSIDDILENETLLNRNSPILNKRRIKYEVSRGPELLKSHEVSRGPELLKSHEVSRGPELLKSHEVSRWPELLNLSTNVSQINEIFNDFQKIIREQGENIERLEEKIEETNIKVEKSVVILKDTETMYYKNFKAKVITGFIILVTAVGTVVGVKVF